VRAGVVAAQLHDHLAVAANDSRRGGKAVRLAGLDRGGGYRQGRSQREVFAGKQLGIGRRGERRGNGSCGKTVRILGHGIFSR